MKIHILTFASCLGLSPLSAQANDIDTIESANLICTPVEECISRTIVRQISLAKSQTQLRHILDKESPPHWEQLSRTGKSEASKAIWQAEADKLDAMSVAAFVLDAIRFARVNDAIYSRSDTDDIVCILQPKLEADLGYGRGTPESSLSAVANEVLRNGDGRRGIYTSFYKYLEVYESALRLNWSGR